ncbi:hypothetical protein CsSME_00012861 [Camellia sinensis var. sinensis]
MASQAHLDKMTVRQNYRNLWHTDLMRSITADPAYCCFSALCAPCVSYMLRKRALYGDMSRYTCCGGYMPCSGRCGESQCPELCLCTEVFLCFANSVASTRFMLQDEFNIQTTQCDNCIIVLSLSLSPSIQISLLKYLCHSYALTCSIGIHVLPTTVSLYIFHCCLCYWNGRTSRGFSDTVLFGRYGLLHGLCLYAGKLQDNQNSFCVCVCVCVFGFFLPEHYFLKQPLHFGPVFLNKKLFRCCDPSSINFLFLKFSIFHRKFNSKIRWLRSFLDKLYFAPFKFYSFLTMAVKVYFFPL